MSEQRSRKGLWVLIGIAGGAGVIARAAGVALAGRKRVPGAPASGVPASKPNQDDVFATPRLEPEIVDVVSADGAELHVRVYGSPDADPIVLSHGWSCSTEFWNPQVNAFAEKYRVITYDLRGHGRSGMGSAPLAPELLADDLAAVLAATLRDGRKATVVGHSMGGMSVVAWARKYPEQVQRYASSVLLASTGTDSLVAETTVIPLPQRFPRVPVPVGRAILGSALPMPESPVTTRAIKYVAMAPGSTPAEVEFCARILTQCPPRARGGWGAALSTLDITDGLKNLQVPTTVLVGAADRLTPPSHARRLAQTLDDAENLERLIVLPGIGHMSSVEAVTDFNAEVKRLRGLK
ncbi:alpha/beta fold hydrolase [Rhodococcus xishaensis]|uniref:Alpha/beta hydrolase n=1 Tax=Rhodococcus xishaensis TaxID=2487364 RepID=A0A438AQI5_9NOCA|nr:alpha/beta hydrolase [Rhodococcus xishaensis]RVW01206.1 alpha/beta hydrolase [Rhodococcus xishaensis]